MNAESSAKKGHTGGDLGETQVRDFLRENPDFFDRHPDVLDALELSHPSGGAVSLVEKQVSVLRERNMEMRKRLNNLTGNARSNDRLYELTRKLVLRMLDADNPAELAAAWRQGMMEEFEVEHASLILFGDPAAGRDGLRVESQERARIEIGALIRGNRAVCGPLRREELAFLFPEAGFADEGTVGSAAVMPLGQDGHTGLIAIGSSDPNHYTTNMGTLFLQHLAEVMLRLLPRLESDDQSQAS